MGYFCVSGLFWGYPFFSLSLFWEYFGAIFDDFGISMIFFILSYFEDILELFLIYFEILVELFSNYLLIILDLPTYLYFGVIFKLFLKKYLDFIYSYFGVILKLFWSYFLVCLNFF